MISRTHKLLKITPKEKMCLISTVNAFIHKPRFGQVRKGKTNKENGNWYQYLCAAVRCQLFPIIYVILYYPSWFLFLLLAPAFRLLSNFIFPFPPPFLYVRFFSLVFEWICVTMMSLIRVHVKAQYSLILSFSCFSSLSNAMIDEARECEVLFLFIIF